MKTEKSVPAIKEDDTDFTKQSRIKDLKSKVNEARITTLLKPNLKKGKTFGRKNSNLKNIILFC